MVKRFKRSKKKYYIFIQNKVLHRNKNDQRGEHNAAPAMTRSNNSRRGCRSKDRRDKNCYKREQRKKQNNKRNRIRFDGVIFSYKRKSPSIRREFHNKYVHWYKKKHEKNVIASKESYMNWNWLKGKPNEKGWYPSRLNMFVNDKYGKKYYPCQ